MTAIAPYYLSVEQTDLTQRRAGWVRKKRSDFLPGVRFIGTDQSPEDPPGGLIARVDTDGTMSAQIPLWGVEGICHGPDNTLLAAGPWAIWKVDRELTEAHTWLSAPWCNYLHTLRPTSDGLIVTSTGADAIFDVSFVDPAVRWSWWAENSGFSRFQDPPAGVEFPVGELRGYKIDTLLQYSHLNSAIAWDENTILATLFHQGALVRIDRSSKAHTVLLSNLIRPHALRRLDEHTVSLANTGAGEACLVTIRTDGSCEMSETTKTDTTWLQDALWTESGWLLVDGANARVVHCTHSGRVLRVDQFDPDWRLYEVLALKTDAISHK